MENKNSAQKMAWFIIGLIIVIGIILISIFVILPNVKEDDDNGDKTEVASSQKREKKNDRITEEFEISGYSQFGSKVEYFVYIEEDDEYKDITINAKDFDLPSNLNKVEDDILLKVTYSPKSLEVFDCSVINKSTGEEIEDVSEENIDKLFNIEYGKKIVKKEWKDTINLSELKENEIYKYTTKEYTEIPEVVNDLEKPCLLYTKSFEDSSYDKTIIVGKKLSENDDLNYANESDTFMIMYCEVDNEEALNLIEDDKIITLSDYKNEDEIDYTFEEYIYNDNKFPVNIVIEENIIDEDETKTTTYTVDAGEICGFNWMVNSAKIEY